MKKWCTIFLLVLSSAIGFTSCTQRKSGLTAQFHYHDDGVAKPKIALIPVYDRSGSEVSWNLSQELTDAFEEKVFQTGRFFLTKDFDMLGFNRIPLHEINPFLDDIEWLAELNTETEFLVFVELVEHNLLPSPSKTMKLFQTHTLDMTMRVKVVDLRGEHPRVILQEVLHDNYYIPWLAEYQKGGWSQTAFSLSPIGLAHKTMIKRIAKQVEDYIILAKLH